MYVTNWASVALSYRLAHITLPSDFSLNTIERNDQAIKPI